MNIHQVGTAAIILVFTGILVMSLMGIGYFMAPIADTAIQALGGGS